jgi:hypothetical protein
MTGPTTTFLLGTLEPGRFDVESSFNDSDTKSLSVLVREKTAKTPTKKGTTPVEPAPRGDFTTDVIELVKNVYGAELGPQDFKDDQHEKNSFKHKLLDLNAKNVQIYFYKNPPYEVALVFDYPKVEHNSINPKIGLCLESFAVGDKAKRAFTGGEDEEAGEAGGEEGSQPVVF